jgi:hypothetical protein
MTWIRDARAVLPGPTLSAWLVVWAVVVIYLGVR